MEPYILAAITVFGSVLTSSGLWAWLQKRDSQRSANTQLLRGLAHDRIIFLGMKYLERGHVTKDEYEDLIKYLWTPYSASGGNGLAEKIMKEVMLLPMRGEGSSYPQSAAQVIHLTEERNVANGGVPRPHSSGRSE